MKDISFPSCQDCEIQEGFFCAFSPGVKAEIGQDKKHLTIKKGEYLFKSGAYTVGLYCLYKGKVKLTKMGKDGKEQILRFSKPGDIIGYRSLLNQEPYQASAIAIEDVYVCLILKNTFLSMVDKNRHFSKNIINLLGDDLKTAEESILGLSQKSVQERIAESLVLLVNTYGYKEDGKTINIKLSRAEIASLAGTTQETTIRTLAKMEKEGYLELNKKEISIPDFNKLMSGTTLFD
ncbi:Crp/Fnr family transcriptional regulator [Brumimicrobium salinarum]|uniref:Crp/Fnr family transcriptional regulator n=1 Tax=Brumimicrobium salinarum TaxID=2058658 RepID=A0A2I0R632_9FLAO|nr:Crp/Fnr family transcriptional regulator [Brumimicrobium salinarum]PKR82033.1 Crp/Fnr family transcriptional regulator [Brumimicrobium salinarum]